MPDLIKGDDCSQSPLLLALGLAPEYHLHTTERDRPDLPLSSQTRTIIENLPDFRYREAFTFLIRAAEEQDIFEARACGDCRDWLKYSGYTVHSKQDTPPLSSRTPKVKVARAVYGTIPPI